VRIALATAAEQVHTDQDDEPLLAALVAAGHEASLVPWDDPSVLWEHQDAVVVRTAWDYHHRRDDFVAWAQQVEGVTRLFNPAEVIRWNTHKSYLLELEERGAPLVPTAWLARGDTVDLPALARTRGWDQVVVKPAVGAGGDGVHRVDPAAGQERLEELLAAGDALVQPFLETIASRGELSVILFDGQVSHAVRKRPADGAFLVQIEHGGTYEPLDAVPADAAELAAWVVATTGHDLLYARVDLVPDAVGVWQLTELELAEPGLFLHLVPGSAERFVTAIEARLGAAAPRTGAGGHPQAQRSP
jgi:glutathione synthase/RimK-type ligase-like ATP-grasp enzyme